MKKITATMLMLSVILSLISCGSKYEPVPSTEEEKRVIMTLSLDGERYDVKYELYRSFFLAYKNEIDGGSPEVWSGENRSEYIERINERIIFAITEIYSAFHLCDKIGINVFSSSYDDEIEGFISESVDTIIAITESEEKREVSDEEGYRIYLQRLKERNLSYEAHILLYRYQIALEEIEEYYIGTFIPESPNPNDDKGHLEYTKNDVKAFYDGDGSVRLLEAFISTDATDAELRAAELQMVMTEKAKISESAVASHIIANSTADASEVNAGIVIGKYQLDEMYWAEYTDAAFALSVGEVSECIKVGTDNGDAYYVLYRGAKSDAHFESNYTSIETAYRYNEVGSLRSEIKSALAKSAQMNDAYGNIVHADIEM